MSSTVAESEKSSKKRKHEGDEKEPKRKKHRHEETTIAAPNGIDDSPSKLHAKAKKKSSEMKEQQLKNEVDETSMPKLNGGSQDSTSVSEKKKKKRRRKDAETEESHREATVEEGTLIETSQTDAEMLDAPVLDKEGTPLEHAVFNTLTEEHSNERLLSDAQTCFHSTRMSIYLPIPAIASTSQLSALLTVHLSPLLLTFFPPAGGVILSYHDPVISARPEPGLSQPLRPPLDGTIPNTNEESLSKLGEEFGASWVWLTVTFLVFRPEPGDELEGWTNVMSEGFVGLVSYNYFQTSISRNRIPKSWTWNGPSRQRPRSRKPVQKGKLNDGDSPSQEMWFNSQDTVVAREDDAADGIAGSFEDENGEPVSENLKFKVVDLEMIQAQERGRMFALQLEGTLLGDQEEEEVREEERLKWEARMNKSKSRTKGIGTPLMSGGLPTHSRAGSVISTP